MARINFGYVPMCDNECENCPHYNDEIDLCDYSEDYQEQCENYYEEVVHHDNIN